jgi:hypothetical protein
LAQLSLLQKFFNGQSDVFRDLTQQAWRNIPASMHWHRRATAIPVPILNVRTALPNHFETEPFQNPANSRRFENGNIAHSQAMLMV